MFGSPIKYSDFFKQPIPDSPIELILNIPKDELITSICAINARLKPIYNSGFDNSKEIQIECIRAILLDLNNPIDQGYSLPLIKRFLDFSDNYILFTRVTCLFAYQEILGNNNFTSIKPKEYTPQQRINLFRFLLISNEKILYFDQLYSDNDSEILGNRFFEYFMFKELPHNQYNYVSNPINKFYKGWYLMDKLSKDTFFSTHIFNYLKLTFGINNISEFFKYIIGQFFQSNDDSLKITYLKIDVGNKVVIDVLKKLAERKNLPIPTDTDLKILDFLEIKKSPVYDGGATTGIHTFIIMDSILFLEKIYALFINDFWFDYLKPNNICNRKYWGNFIGANFFEPFINEIFKKIDITNSKITYLNSDFLKFNIEGNGHVEYADFYLRQKNKVILIEAKSNYLPLVNGYKNVKTKEDFDKIDIDKFYKDFGIYQLVNKTIYKFNIYKSKIKDKELVKKGKIKIYPLIIVNETIISLGFSSFAFRKKFDNLLLEKGVDRDSKTIRVLPLSIINISELQDVEQMISDRELSIFNLLQMHFSATDFKKIKTTTEAAIPLSVIINRNVPNDLRIARRIRKFDWLGF